MVLHLCEILFFLYSFLHVYIPVFFLHVYLCTTCTHRGQKISDFPEVELQDSCEWPCGYWELNPMSLEKERVLWTTEPPLLPYTILLEYLSFLRAAYSLDHLDIKVVLCYSRPWCGIPLVPPSSISFWKHLAFYIFFGKHSNHLPYHFPCLCLFPENRDKTLLCSKWQARTVWWASSSSSIISSCHLMRGMASEFLFYSFLFFSLI